jgi:poly(ADP-ribose) glycohydrolase ARH3
MTVALAEALTSEGRDATPNVIAGYFAEHFEPGRCYGGSVNGLLKDMRGGMEWSKALAKNKPPGGSWGNGAAMRVSPLAFTHAHADNFEVAVKRHCASTGHTHPDAMEMAWRHAHTIREVAGRSLGGISTAQLLEDLQTMRVLGGAIAWAVTHSEATPEEAALAMGSGLRATESVPCALWAFMSAAERGPMAVIEQAVAIGGDSDTIASMAGALAGAHYGETNWPTEVVAELENGDFGRDFLLSLADDLAVMWDLSRYPPERWVERAPKRV